MATTQATVGTPAATPSPELYFYPQHKCYECLGCHELIEIPRFATLMVDGKMQRVRLDNPEMLLIFRELHELDHEKCGAFGQDEAKAKDAREHRKVIRR